jgi:cytochrome b561
MDSWVGAPRLAAGVRPSAAISGEHPKLRQWIAKANEYGLYVLLFVQPITGLGDAVFHGRPFTLFIWQVPSLLAPDAAIRDLFQEAHELGAKALLALIGLHAAPRRGLARRCTATDAALVYQH